MWTEPFDRRKFIVGGIAAGLLMACGDDGPKPDFLAARFADGLRADTTFVAGAGPQRFPFIVIADDGFPLIDEAPESIEIELTRDGSVVETVEVARRGAGQFTPYYPLVFTPPEAGRYVATASFADIGNEFVVAERSEVSLFQIGDPLPPFDTPTFDDARGVDPVCTRAEPCPFHEITLTEALENGRPTALLIATPEFCQTDVCGPSVEFLIEAGSNRGDMNLIHAEVFADPRSASAGPIPELSPLLIDWELEFEPSIFVADASGTIVDARHYAIDRDELKEAIASV